MLDINGIRPFHDHPFHLYEGERLDDMVESIKEHGILNPVIVRKMHYGYEMLSGHNRQNAGGGELAGLTQIPAIVKENLSDADAYVYVIETNLMQRSFTDLSISEKAAVLAERYDKVLYQRKRDEIVEELKALEGADEKGGHSDHLSKNRDSLGQEYGLSGSSVARLLRVNQLIPEIKEMLDKGNMQLMAAVQLSYLPEQAQRLAIEASKKSGIAINKEIASKVRKAPMTEKAITEAIAGKRPEVDPAYFNIIMADDMDVTVQSRNTGHYWYLHCTGYPTDGSCVIFHKHKFSHPYHQHGRGNSLRQAIRSIQSHDRWQMNGRQG